MLTAKLQSQALILGRVKDCICKKGSAEGTLNFLQVWTSANFECQRPVATPQSLMHTAGGLSRRDA